MLTGKTIGNVKIRRKQGYWPVFTKAKGFFQALGMVFQAEVEGFVSRWEKVERPGSIATRGFTYGIII